MRACVETESAREQASEGTSGVREGGKEYDETDAKVFQLPNPRNLGHRVGTGASEEIGVAVFWRWQGGGT